MRKKNSANRQIKQFRFEQLEARQLMAINIDGPDTYITAGNSNNETEFIGSGNGGGTNRSPATELKAAFSWEMEKRFTDAGGFALLRNYREFVDPGTFKVDFNGRLSEIPPAISPATYAWEIIANGQVRQRGNGHSLTANLEEGSYYASLKITGNNGQVSTYGENFVVNDILIVSIGDSIASGEGNPEIAQVINEYIVTSDVESEARWAFGDPDAKRAHRSTKANPAQAAIMLEHSDPHTSVTFVSVAASGATIDKGILGEYEGIDRDGGFVSREEEQRIEAWFGRDVVDSYEMPPQILQVKEIVRDREIDALLVSIGANDISFSEITSDLVSGSYPGLPYLVNGDTRPPQGVFDHKQWLEYAKRYTTKIESEFAALPAGYALLAENFKQLKAPNVFITEYPDPTRNEKGDYEDFLEVLHLEVDTDEAKWATTTILEPLNAAVAEAAAKHGWNYIGGIAAAFRDGHGYAAGEGQRWIRTIDESRRMQGPFSSTAVASVIGASVGGMIAGGSGLFLGGAIGGGIAVLKDFESTKGTLHPNEAGHKAIASILVNESTFGTHIKLQTANDGPRVIAVQETHLLGPQANTVLVEVEFNKPIDAETFTKNDVVVKSGSQQIEVVQVKPQLGSKRFQIELRRPAPGKYRLEIGSDVRDPQGVWLDQDNDGASGARRDGKPLDTFVSSLEFQLPVSVRNGTLFLQGGMGDDAAEVGVNSAGQFIVKFAISQFALMPNDPRQTYNFGNSLQIVQTFTPSQVQRIEFVGGAGNDWIINSTSRGLTAKGEAGDDLLIGGSGVNDLDGGTGNDTLTGGPLRDILHGGVGDDLLKGFNGDDVLFGELGDDTLEGGFGNDTLWGGIGNDRLRGEAGNDHLYGEIGNDRLDGGSDVDRLFGGDGDDWLDGGTGQVDVLNGGAGSDSYVDYYYLLAFNMYTQQFKQEDNIVDFETGFDERRVQKR